MSALWVINIRKNANRQYLTSFCNFYIFSLFCPQLKVIVKLLKHFFQILWEQQNVWGHSKYLFFLLFTWSVWNDLQSLKFQIYYIEQTKVTMNRNFKISGLDETKKLCFFFAVSLCSKSISLRWPGKLFERSILLQFTDTGNSNPSSHRTRNIQSWFKENSNPITHTNNSCPDSRKIPILVLIQYTCNIMSWFKENSNPITKQIIPVLIQKNSCPLKIILFWFKENSPFTNNPVLIQEEFQPYYILSCSNSSRILILLHIILSWFKQNSNPITFYPVLIQ